MTLIQTSKLYQRYLKDQQTMVKKQRETIQRPMVALSIFSKPKQSMGRNDQVNNRGENCKLL